MGYRVSIFATKQQKRLFISNSLHKNLSITINLENPKPNWKILIDDNFDFFFWLWFFFPRFDMDMPIYVNLVRDPVERVISWYYYVRAPWYFVERKRAFPDLPLPNPNWLRKVQIALTNQYLCTVLKWSLLQFSWLKYQKAKSSAFQSEFSWTYT